MALRFGRIINAVLTLLALALATAAQAKQVALVVANADYEHTSKLSNPVRDATLVSAALREAGFDTVELGTDLDRGEFMEQLRAFRSAADGADAALVYFAGHGIESDGRNWLLPTDTKLDAEKDLPFEAVELQLLLDTLDGAKLRIAVLDACRNNPYANRWTSESRSVTRGLAPYEMDDILVIYAAAPGAVAYDGAGGNSPFALALSRRIVQPGLPVQMLGGFLRDDVMQLTQGEQRPFISASMGGEPRFLARGPQSDEAMAMLKAMYLWSPNQEEDLASKAKSKMSSNLGLNSISGLGKDGAMSKRTVDFAKVADNLSSTRSFAEGNPRWLDEQTWLETLKADTIPAYRSYLAEFPDGLYAPFAEANINQLLDPTATGGELNSDKPWIISLGAALPNRYAVDLADKLPIDGIWRISTNNKRLRIERGRAFAVDGWNHALLFKVKPDQVTMTNMREAEPGLYLGRDILLNGDAELTLREDGNLDVKVSLFPFPAKFQLIREGLDDPGAL
ncbi:MAG: caspase family protein, partial [Erythrobacter sp.]|nr:caspase family protein [Erythrobacter sp.]